MALPEVSIAPRPTVLRATGLTLRTRKGTAFADVDLTLPAGELVSVCGPAGSGRTMLLLALTGRAAGVTGTVAVGGSDRVADVRRHTAVAPTGGAVALEPELTVGAQEREYRQFLGRGAGDLDELAALVGLPLRRDERVGELPVVDQRLLGLALGALGRPAVLVADDVETNLDAAERNRVAAALRALADAGITVVAAGCDPIPGADAVLRLGGSRPALEPATPADGKG